jgi:transcriptional regulator with XRE-family HTH domain
MRFDKYAYEDKRGERSDVLPRLNRSALAREIGVSRSQLSRIFAGSLTPPLHTLQKLAGALDATLDEMVEFLKRNQKKTNSKNSKRSKQ